MRSSFLPAHAQHADAPSSHALIARGLNYIQQERFAEGMALLELARECLLPHQAALVPLLDMLQATLIKHIQAQAAFHEASRRFVESSNEQQVQIAACKQVLASLLHDIHDIPHIPLQVAPTGVEQRTLQLLPALNASQHVHNHTAPQAEALPALSITCFGRFSVRRMSEGEQAIALCRNLKGQMLLRYLVTHPKRQETIDALLDALWGDDESDTARHKLQVAVSALRRSLNSDITAESGRGYILCKGQHYLLNPAVVIHSDVEEFLALYRAGLREADQGQALMAYERACQLYTGPFLAEDLYADWSFPRREELTRLYLCMCNRLAEARLQAGRHDEAIRWAEAILQQDRSDEDAHRQLIRAYLGAGRRSEALRQYQRCQRALQEELGVQPTLETQKLVNQV